MYYNYRTYFNQFVDNIIILKKDYILKQLAFIRPSVYYNMYMYNYRVNYHTVRVKLSSIIN